MNPETKKFIEFLHCEEIGHGSSDESVKRLKKGVEELVAEGNKLLEENKMIKVKTVKTIVRQWLIDNGYDGLYGDEYDWAASCDTDEESFIAAAKKWLKEEK